MTCTQTSTTWTPWKTTCATPPRKASTPTTSPTPSQFPTEAMQWIKEVELVDSVDDLRSSSSTRGISMPNFEVLDARIASSLNKTIHNSQLKRRISLEDKKPRGRQIAYLITITFGSLGATIQSKTTPTCSPLFFEMTIFRNVIPSGTEIYCP